MLVIAKKLALKSKGDAKSAKSHRHAVLNAWLPNRPTRNEVVNLAILDLGERFEHARRELEIFFTQHLDRLERQLDEASYGVASYSPKVIALLEMDTLLSHREAAQNDVAKAQAHVDACLNDCRHFVAGKMGEVLHTASRVNNMAQQLCEDGEQLQLVLDAVSPHIENVRAKMRKKYCLQATYDMLEKTDKLRIEVFRSKLPWELVEELPTLCSNLPPGPLRETSFSRVRFLLSPLKDQLVPVLRKALTGIWPVDQGAKIGDGSAVMRAMGDLLRLQNVHDVVTDGKEERWIFEIFGSKLIEQFRYHFRRESDTNQLAKPEWAFRYIWAQIENHTEALLQWQQDFGESNVQNVDLSQGLATVMASELREFLSHRWTHLIKPNQPDPSLFLHTLHHLIQLVIDWRQKYPGSAKFLTEDLESQTESVEDASESGDSFVDDFAELLQGTSKLPLFDAWVAADVDALQTKFSELVSSGQAWAPGVDSYPCIYVQTVVDALSQCRQRQQFFRAAFSHQLYQSQVIDVGARFAKETLARHWNSLNGSLVGEENLRTVSIVIQGLSDVLAPKLLSCTASDDIEQLRTLAIDQLCQDILCSVRDALKVHATGLGHTLRFFSVHLGSHIAQLRVMFKDAIHDICKALSRMTTEVVVTHLLNEVKFDVMEQVHLCVTNCRDDLVDAFHGFYVKLDTKTFERLWHLVSILALSKDDALAMRRDHSTVGVSDRDAMRVLHSRPDLKTR